MSPECALGRSFGSGRHYGEVAVVVSGDAAFRGCLSFSPCELTPKAALGKSVWVAVMASLAAYYEQRGPCRGGSVSVSVRGFGEVRESRTWGGVQCLYGVRWYLGEGMMQQHPQHPYSPWYCVHFNDLYDCVI